MASETEKSTRAGTQRVCQRIPAPSGRSLFSVCNGDHSIHFTLGLKEGPRLCTGAEMGIPINPTPTAALDTWIPPHAPRTQNFSPPSDLPRPLSLPPKEREFQMPVRALVFASRVGGSRSRSGLSRSSSTSPCYPLQPPPRRAWAAPAGGVSRAPPLAPAAGASVGLRAPPTSVPSPGAALRLGFGSVFLILGESETKEGGWGERTVSGSAIRPLF